MAEKRRETDERTGKYGGGDGALEHEHTLTAPGEEAEPTDMPAEEASQAGASDAQKKQEHDLETGEENPG